MRLIICTAALLFIGLQAQSQSIPESDYYYGVPAEELSQNPDLKLQLHYILKSCHKEQDGFDELVWQTKERGSCYKHEPLGYKTARKRLFGALHLSQDHDGAYWVRTTYCDDVVTNADIPGKPKLGELTVPFAEYINTEHSWPQSRFTANFSRRLQKSDLHALFPVYSRVNSTRGNSPFGEVVEKTRKTCQNAKFGYNSDHKLVFEPTEISKGNIARAIFYFSTRYNIKIDPGQESTLRQWHEIDPVDFQERERHEEIFKLQKVRNPYIDHPEWVAAIDNF